MTDAPSVRRSAAPRSLARAATRAAVLLAALVLAGSLASCGAKGSPTGPTLATRSYRMGFSGVPPRYDQAQAVAAINMWSTRADAATFTDEPPWDSLLAGVPPESIVVREKLPLANYWRAKGMDVWVYVDPANGVDRSADSNKLQALGRSIREAEIQQLYRRWCVVMDSIVRPSHMGFAMETNLVRRMSPPDLYAAVRQVAADAAADVRARDATVKQSISIQADFAQIALLGLGEHEVETDLAHFPFAQELGLSSYPNLAGWKHPDSLSVDYYRRLMTTRPTVPVFVTEGGWSSITLDTLVSSPEMQRLYIEKQGQMLAAANAIAYFQLTFTDLDLTSWPPPIPPILDLFAHMGMVDADLNPKPALSAWDALYARPYVPR